MAASTSTKQREPASALPFKYILATSEGQTVVFNDRPTQNHIRDTYGEGTHNLYRADGQLLRRIHIDTNRNGNLRVASVAPDGLDSLSRLNLDRAAKSFIRLVRIWNGYTKEAKAIQKEMAFREGLISDAEDAFLAQDEVA